YQPLLTTYQGSTYQSGLASCASQHSYGCLTSGELSDATAALQKAETKAGSYTQYTNVLVYTPDASEPNGGKNASQEYIVVHTPEASSLGIMSVNLLGLMAVVFIFRRKRGKANG